jgi:hypothetical protein
MTHVGAQKDQGDPDILKSTGRISLPIGLDEGKLSGLAELLAPLSQELQEIKAD